MFNAIGAHIYAGGFTIGVAKHFNVLAHLEHSGYGADVVGLNWPQMPIHAGGPSTWPTSWPGKTARPRFMYCNPPCAIWSGASHGRAGRWQDDPRLSMHREIFGYAMDVVQPDVLAIESVPPSFVRGREYIDELIEKASGHGYSTTVAMHNAKWLGVPQNRSRIFYTFHKVSIPWQHPPFGAPTTVRQALKGVKMKKGGYDMTLPPKLAQWARLAQPGEGLAKIFNRENPEPQRGDRGQIVGRPSFLDGRVPLDKPAGVLLGGKAIHPTELRFMCQEELAAICGFPQDYRWPKLSFNDISSYMSRGIMPPVADWLAENVNRALIANKRLNAVQVAVLDVTRPPGGMYVL
jgi:site-specific DNA-cytosine methylase